MVSSLNVKFFSYHKKRDLSLYKSNTYFGMYAQNLSLENFMWL